MTGEFEKLAPCSIVRCHHASWPTSVLGSDGNVLATIGLAAFVLSIGGGVFILLPKRDLVFAEAGAELYRSLYTLRQDLPEVYRQLIYNLDSFWDANDRTIARLAFAYVVAAGALAVEVLSMVALLGSRIV